MKYDIIWFALRIINSKTNLRSEKIKLWEFKFKENCRQEVMYLIQSF